MRRYFVDSVEEDDMAYKSSQSLRHSEHSSPQLENSQCSSFDIYSQVMSQQQGFNSQPSEVSVRVETTLYYMTNSKCLSSSMEVCCLKIYPCLQSIGPDNSQIYAASCTGN